ncbi:MAG: hypothetical protein K2F69_01305 [Bacteroidaceae bacterium]|nr:hypothetical protein [Bacteroidaceae bacterium]
MSYKQSLFAMLLTISGVLQSNAQITSFLNEEQFRASINLVDDFIARFNGEKDKPGTNKQDKDYETNRILYLFNGKMFKSFEDPMFLEAKNFADSVVKNKTKVSYNDTTWVAKAECCGRLKGKEIGFTLYLTVEKRTEEMYKWVITKASGDAFKLKPARKATKAMLMPDDHETNFMSLNRITTERDDYITYYASKHFVVDETSVFFSLVYSGQLDIEYVSDLQFVFLQVPGYKFSIKHFERETNNAGWLINSFEKFSDKEKKEYLNYIFI